MAVCDVVSRQINTPFTFLYFPYSRNPKFLYKSDNNSPHSDKLVTNYNSKLIHPLLPPAKPRRFRYPGRRRVEDRAALTGIVFVLKSGIPWEMLPQEMGCGSGMTCWRRLKEWHDAGVWQNLHEVLLAKLREADEIDWSRAVVDSASIRAVGGGGEKQVPTPRTEPSQAANIM